VLLDSPPAVAPEPGSVAVVIPCRDEAATVAKVVGDFRAALPGVRIVVVDNGSTDGTAARAREAGAEVVRENRPGKGFALLRGFRCARGSDFVVMVDGDDTYPAEAVGELLAAARAGADMVVATRLEGASAGALPGGHSLGNRLFISLVRLLFGIRTRDLFSGFRVLSRSFVDELPLIARGFEIEAELSMQALARGFPVAEVAVSYRPRPRHSASKLHTFRDGYRILRAILAFFRDYRPLAFFGLLAFLLLLLSLSWGSLVIAQYIETGKVLRIPLAIVAAGLFILSALSLACGILLSSINRRAAEIASLLGDR
jgi:glycosyltransferase involved in cell wall biosynthesis